jgi:hypothetical protein
MQTASQAESIYKIVDYVISHEYIFVIEEMASYETFDEWKNFVLNDSVYGAALKIQFSNFSETEMIRDLEQDWEKHH